MTVHMDDSVDPAYPVYGGLFREEAIMLLRRFYVQENDKGESLCVCLVDDMIETDDDMQPRSRSQRRTASSRLRSCLPVCLLVATLRRTWSRLLLLRLVSLRPL
jgi:hypothetical protein